MKIENVNRALYYLILAGDLAWIVMSVSLARVLPGNFSVQQETFAALLRNPALAVMFALWIMLYLRKDLAGFQQGWHAPTVIAHVVVAVAYVLIGFGFSSLAVSQYYPYRSFVSLALLLIAGFVGIRYAVHFIIDSRLRKHASRRVIIVGSGRMVPELMKKIARHPELCMEVVGVLFPCNPDGSQEHFSLGSDTVTLRTLGILDQLKNANADELILIEPIPPGSETEQLLASCREAGLQVRVLPQQYELYLSKARLMEIEDVPLLSLEEHALCPWSIHMKSLLDIVGATLLLVLTMPLLLVSALLLHWSKGQVFRKELRCGQEGRPFLMFRLNIQRECTTLKRFERLLLQFSFTELPQLFNVLKGEMSLVGPRPEAIERVKHYSMWQRQRLSVRPGLTGLAQVHGFREQHSSDEKAHFDLQYIFHWSLFLDVCLIVQTAWTLLQRMVWEHKIVLPSLLPPVSGIKLELGRICDADSAQSGTD
ncbi:MAG TPA: sugar transferase [Terriglobales bacterium]|nr:sugar transferase [Terriglobales bacterium]